MVGLVKMAWGYLRRLGTDKTNCWYGIGNGNIQIWMSMDQGLTGMVKVLKENNTK